MRVRLLSDYADAEVSYTPAGAVLDLEPATARRLLATDRAEPIWFAPEVAVVSPKRQAAKRKARKR
jgi:hypothetical protein